MSDEVNAKETTEEKEPLSFISEEVKEEVKQLTPEEEMVNLKACDAKIGEVLKEFNCQFALGMLVTKDGNFPQMQLQTRK